MWKLLLLLSLFAPGDWGHLALFKDDSNVYSCDRVYITYVSYVYFEDFESVIGEVVLESGGEVFIAPIEFDHPMPPGYVGEAPVLYYRVDLPRFAQDVRITNVTIDPDGEGIIPKSIQDYDQTVCHSVLLPSVISGAR